MQLFFLFVWYRRCFCALFFHRIAQKKGHQTPSFIKKYVDDILAKFRIRPPEGMKTIDNFLSCLNQVHERVQFTVEYEENEEIPFLDCHIKRLPNGKVTTTVYRKSSDTNLTINPASCQHPNNITGTFKGFLCRAYRVCSTPELLKTELENLLDIWEDNGHNRAKLQQIVNTYKPPPTQPTQEDAQETRYNLRNTTARQQQQQHVARN